MTATAPVTAGSSSSDPAVDAQPMHAKLTGMKRSTLVLACLVMSAVGMSITQISQKKEWKSGIPWKEPVKVDPGVAPAPSPVPSDAIVLFGGRNLDAWEHVKTGDAVQWPIADDAFTISGNGLIQTRRAFGDVQLHIEWAIPAEVRGNGQGRGNSGVFFMDAYEVQILDSYGNTTYPDGQAGAIYKQSPPLVNASRGPGEWQSYDIVFERPRFDAEGNAESPAYLTVFHNGVVIQHRYALQGSTDYTKPPAYTAHADAMPISLQDHGNPVKFRNIWVRELKLSDAERQEETPVRKAEKQEE